MSLSKLESLPNEILTDIIEKYMNGVDVLKAVAFQQNRRFDQLILQSQRLRFNFLGCHKDDFRFCMGVLPAYMDKIEELTISEDHTPGQVHAFLSFYPSFQFFPRLRTLYFQFDEKATNWTKIDQALNSLMETNIQMISITAKILNNEMQFQAAIARLFRIKSLRGLSIVVDLNSLGWKFLRSTPTTIEYLNIGGVYCTFEDLENILQISPRLKYVSVEIEGANSRYEQRTKSMQKIKAFHLPNLRTLLLSFSSTSSITIRMLEEWFHCMPQLTRLEIKAHLELLSADAWKVCLETTLPSLTHFTLHTSTSVMQGLDLEKTLRSFQNSYWVEKKNFNFMVTKHKHSNLNYRFRQRNRNSNSEFRSPVIECWTAPDRSNPNKFTIINDDLRLAFVDSFNYEQNKCFFKNVTSLELDTLDPTIFSWMKIHMNCFGIKQLTIQRPQINAHVLSPLLNSLSNIVVFRLNFDLLFKYLDIFSRQRTRVKELDLSFNGESFDGEHLEIIGRCFPYLEHLKVDVKNVNAVFQMQQYLPYLRSFSFKISSDDISSFFSSDYEQMDRYILSTTSTFLCSLNSSIGTVWIDEASFTDQYWAKFKNELPVPSLAPTTKRKKKSKFSFFKFFS